MRREERDEPVVLLLVVDDRALEVLGEDVAHDADREVGLLEDERRRRRFSTRCSRTSWSLKRYCSSRSKSSRLAPCAAVRMIAPPPCRSRPLASLAQALALLVVEALGDADALAGRRVDHVAPGDRELHRQPRALGLQRVLDDLDDDLLARLEQVGDPLAAVLARGRAAGSRRPGRTISSTCRKPFLSRPMSTNAASRPARTLSTRPL